MKDLCGIRKRDVDKLHRLGLIPEGAIVHNDGRQNSRGEWLYNVFFDTSEEKQIAYDAIYESDDY